MESECAHIEELLSAFMDGELSAADAAKVAGHLESCPVCSARLDELRRLDEFADTALTDFDDSLMDRLADRINAAVATEEISSHAPTKPKARIIPLWYRYAAVAATIIIVASIGHIAQKETGGDFRQDIRQSIRTPLEAPIITPPLDISTNDGVDEAVEPAATDDFRESEKKSESRAALNEQPEKQKAPAQIPPSTAEGSAMKPAPQPIADQEAEPPSRSKKIASAEPIKEEMPAPEPMATISGQVTDERTQEPLSGATVQVKGTPLGAVTDSEGNFEIQNIPSDTYDLVLSSIGYETVEIRNVDMVDKDAGRREIVMSQAVLALDKNITVPKADDTVTPPIWASSDPIAIDSLEIIYSNTVSAYMFAAENKGQEMMIGLTASENKKKTAVSRKTVTRGEPAIIRAMLDSVEAEKTPDKAYQKLENLYMRMRASYDLYTETGEEHYLARARELKNEMMLMINQRLEDDEDNEILKEYKTELERLTY